ncbi:carboxypeptidase-like regulatory domain-containing protein [Cellulophaga sp. L1A9]|uniref:carboxypeptidase-like regulatory domain-containing protein n=1 Tax=Cellulophaga sp. L1A9 TaxID=2686362 RepID=UPI0021071A71|nr:carboxypeptidase-like regulatory domain-containing protein [Cellulophaga sp. L1A9]
MRNILRTHFFFLLLFLVSNTILSQQGEYIVGKLMDSETQESIAFASIRIKDRALGIISNIDGSFKIPLKYKEYGDIIEISSMEYQTKEIIIHDFSIYELNDVILQASTLELEEAVVIAEKKNKLTARKIVRRALRLIPENYPVESFSTVGYYRDYQLDNLRYINLNEAILEVFDEGFDAIDSATTKVKIFDYLENNDFKRDTLTSRSYDYQFKEGRKVIDKAFLASYGGNEFTILKVHDAIRNYKIDSYSFVHRLKSDLLSEHKFKKESDTYLDDEPLYTIKFNKLLSGYSAYGTMYISKRNFEIYKMEYAVYDRKKTLPNGISNRHKTNNQQVFEIITEYRPKNDRMYLNYISFHNTFKIWEPPKFVLDSTDVDIVQRCFAMSFNRPPDLQGAINGDNYILKYKGEKIGFKEIVYDDTDKSRKTILLYPKMKSNKAKEMFRSIAIAASKGTIDSLFFSSKVYNMYDVDGNLINEWTSKDYDQFREFFVQEVKPNVNSRMDSLFMDKQRPIFKDQPIIKPNNFDDYWMNTPLKNIIK